ncbi:PolC-type DNA polymerase III [Mycoplasmopsis columbinasalis]|uniref:DNA polymerase III PolC-type n=1 Tax=Mycoplasmopsis columbinasalis TaxID=114880 RepID=A0A449BAT5_9BACT|nr:PolC-type DNA polymerase III [Mycoplasmopsis columbinasalis]VEU78304.1 DNA polymerase III polC-type [Mycoplasmopsis columbinasalis]
MEKDAQTSLTIGEKTTSEQPNIAASADQKTRQQRFQKLCRHLNTNLNEMFPNTEITQLEMHPDQSLFAKIKICDKMHFDEFIHFRNTFSTSTAVDISVKYEFDEKLYQKALIGDYLQNIIETKSFFKWKVLLSSRPLVLLEKNADKFSMIFKVADQNLVNDTIAVTDKLESELHNCGFVNLILRVEMIATESGEAEYETPANTISNEAAVKVLSQQQRNAQVKSAAKDKYSSPTFTKKRWDNIAYQEINLKQIWELEDKSPVQVVGEIFDFEYKKLNNSSGKNHLYIISLTDFQNAVQIQLFLSEALTETEQKTLRIGNWISVKGKLAIKVRQYNEQRIIYGDSFSEFETPNIRPMDNMPPERKRIELHVSSKMSTMDALIDPEDIIKKAAEFKMPAVAIMDLDGCQGYPKFYTTAKKLGVKPLMGTSFTTIERGHEAVWGARKFEKTTLRELAYVAFDIETTSLYARFGEIIEYGWADIKNNLKIEKLNQFFIQAKEPLSVFTTNLTGIKQEDVLSGLTIDKAFDEIYDNLNGKIAIAHNAKFDYYYIKQKCLEYKKPFPEFTIIDTLKVSGILFPNDKRHNLNALAKRLDVEYQAEVAHRADYDANVLANVWVKLVGILEEKGITTLDQLAKLVSQDAWKKERGFEVSTLCKNNEGLKEQFKLVSKALTDQYWDSAKLFWDDLQETKNLLIGSGALRGRLLEEYFYGSQDTFEAILDRFDYIEVPAPAVFKHFVEYGDLTWDQVHSTLKDIILTAKQKGKLVVAIGDVKYLNPFDQYIYKIVVYAKGIANSRHYLFNFEKAKQNELKIPQQHFFTTEEMLTQFAFLQDEALIEEIVITNTHKIADLCEEVEVIKKGLFKPEFDDSDHKLRALVYENAHKLYGEKLPEFIEQRIESEIEPIIKFGYSVIYWISHVLIKMSTDRGYIVGSRGSVGSSFVAFLSDISIINPLPPHYICQKCKLFELANLPKITSGFDLPKRNCPNCNVLMHRDGQLIPFETFLGFNAEKVPDIDLNFSGDVQGEIHQEVRNLFGEFNTFRAGTISTVASKTAYGYVKAFMEETGEHADELFVNYLAKQIEGIKRTTSQHAGGIIIIPKEKEIYDFTPLNFPAGETESTWKTTHFDYKAIHDNLLKLDILGHDNPTIFKMLETMTKFKTAQIPYDDPDVIKLFCSPEPMGIKSEQIDNEPTGALGLPEYGTKFVRKILTVAAPKSFADLVSLCGLSHGTNVWLNNAEDLILKNNLTLSDVVSCRDDILVKLMALNVPRSQAFEIMEKVRHAKKTLSAEDEALLVKHNVPQWQIESMKKIQYMFPKAHAVAYAQMAWWTAYYKLYFPLEFYAVYFSIRTDVLDLDNMVDMKFGTKAKMKLHQIKRDEQNRSISTTDEKLLPIFEICQELYARGYYIDNVSLTNSEAVTWKVDHQRGCLIPPFNAVKQLGEAVANSIVKAREEKPFKSIEDFTKRTLTNSSLIKKLEEMNVFENLDQTNQMQLNIL